MEKAIIYSRVSTEIQDFTRQTNELLSYAKYKNLDVVETFEEKVSGTSYFQHKRANGNDNAYKCLSKRYNYKANGIECNNPSIGIDKLNNALLHHLKHNKKLNFKRINKNLLSQLSKEVIILDKKLKQLAINQQLNNNRINELIKLKINNQINDSDYNKEYYKLNRENEVIIKDLNTNNTLLYDNNNTIQLLKKGNTNIDITNMKEVVNELINKIVINKAKEDFYLNHLFKVKGDKIVLIDVYFKNKEFLRFVISQRSNVNLPLNIMKGYPEKDFLNNYKFEYVN